LEQWEKKWRFSSGLPQVNPSRFFSLCNGFHSMKNKTLPGLFLFLTFMIAFPWSSHAQEMGDPDCSHLLLISSFSGNNVKIYDACDGSFIQNLDSKGYLAGVQAIALDPQGDLVVVSEGNNRLVRYHRGTLTYDKVLAGDRPETPQNEPAPVRAPTGLIITPGGRMFAGSYSDQVVTEIDPATGNAVANIVTSARSGIMGPDTGMFLDGNRLLVPGFDSSTVVEVDITQPGSDKQLVSAGAGGLNAPRTILKLSNGNLLVTSWRGNKIMEFNGASGAFVRDAVTAIDRPTGMAFESANILLVASDRTNNISRVRLSDGVVLDTLVNSVPGPTFILRLEKQASNLPENNSFWVIGVGVITGTTIQVDQMSLTTGGQFGDALNPAAINNVPWGSLEIQFHSCDDGQVDWIPTEAGFEAGFYDIVRIANDALGTECRNTGFDLIDHNLWMNGIWYGGQSRDGEGFSINVIDGGLAVVTWYTYRP
jgi:hypothetical protein